MHLCKKEKIIILKMVSMFLRLPTTKNEATAAKVAADTALMGLKKLPNNNTSAILILSKSLRLGKY